MSAKIILVLIMLSSIYSWQFASAALIIFAVCSVFVRNKQVQSYITEKNIGVTKRWDVQYLAGLPSLVVKKPIDCSIIIDNDDNLIILTGKLEEKIPLRNINTVTVATKKTLGIGKMFKINYRNTIGETVDIVFKSLNSYAVSEKIMDRINMLSKEKQSVDTGNLQK